MTKRYALATAVATGALIAAALGTPDRAAGGRAHHGAGYQTVRTSAAGCRGRNTLRKLFPRPQTVDFGSRSEINWQEQREPLWPGWCAAWRTEYRGYLGGGGVTIDPFFRQPSTDVSITLYATRRAALTAAFTETPGVPIQVLANGVRLWGTVGTGAIKDEVVSGVSVVSVVRNVMVRSYGIWPPGVFPEQQELDAAIRINARIHAAVLGLRAPLGGKR